MAGIGDDLARLAALRDQGVLTEDEFQTQKARLLGDKPAAAEPPMPPQKKSNLGKGCLIIVGILVLLAIIGAIAGGDEGNGNVATPNGQNAATEATGETTATAEPSAKVDEEPKSPASVGLFGPQANAARSARQYLDMSGFSRLGLIEQLSSDAGNGYSVADATAAVDSLDVDWNEQAVRSAKQYLDMSGFSCTGLIEQLSSDAGSKYTKAQARYGATQAGAC
ncbi:MAG: hypothetical protein GY736_16120 [Sphingomonas sp.]|jgi:hypothetical protein|uniref:Ltp family lipoprotein n=1 Tax=Sphingomonas TaxID=13687 RepID=UPI00037EDC51|nr:MULTISPECIES: Ltp family lipoprotein [Sphingomonas]MCP4027817.1 hypothetical protein [Sphingomonas sp.]